MRISYLTYIVVILMAIFVAVVIVDSRRDESRNPIKIGVMACLTGSCSQWGENTHNGLILATEELNEEGGILGRRVELVVQDSADDKNRVVLDAYNSLRLQGIEFFIGPTWSQAGLPLAPIAKKEDVVVISPSLGLADFNESGDNLFNVWPHDKQSIEEIAKFLVNKGYKRVAVMTIREPWNGAMADTFVSEFTKLGGEITVREEAMQRVADLRTEVLKVISTKPEVIFSTNPDQAAIAARELRTHGYEGLVIVLLLDETVIDSAAGALEGTITMRYSPPKESFTNKYLDRFGTNPNITADSAYDSLILLAQAIETAGSVIPHKVKEELMRIKSYKGVSGELIFDDYGGVTKEPFFWIVKNGNLEQMN